MMESLQSGTERSCPFCNSLFKRLGNHRQHCPQRNGRDYSCYLSQKTIDKRASHSKNKPCPHCGKQFSRLDTHLKNSAQCKTSSASIPSLTTNDQLQDSLSPPPSVHTSDTQASHESPPDLPKHKKRKMRGSGKGSCQAQNREEQTQK